MTARYLDPTNDVAFKKLFNKKERLINLLNSILKLTVGARIKELDYIPVEQMPLFSDGKRNICFISKYFALQPFCHKLYS